MPNWCKIWLFLLLLMVSIPLAYSQSDVIQLTRTAMLKNDASEVLKSSDKVIDISLFGKLSTCSPPQAEAILSNFFSKHNVEKFDILHTGEGYDAKSYYVIGTITTNSQKQLELYLYLYKRKNVWLINEIRID